LRYTAFHHDCSVFSDLRGGILDLFVIRGVDNHARVLRFIEAPVPDLLVVACCYSVATSGAIEEHALSAIARD